MATTTIKHQGKTILISVPRRLALSTTGLGNVSHIHKALTSSTLTQNTTVVVKEEDTTPITSYIKPNTMKIDFDLLESTLDIDDDSNDGGDGEPTRKRKRLSHLSPEERLMRRKMKNRVAAQTARDRKKARMDELEEIVTNLEKENAELSDENHALRLQSENIMAENAQLRNRLDGQNLVEVKNEVESRESAELAHPLLRDHIPPQSPLLNRLLTILTTLSLMRFSTSSKSSAQTQILLDQMRQDISQLLTRHRKRKAPQRSASLHNKWWGPQQKNWTPSMI